MYIQMLYATNKPSGTLTWNNVQHVSGEQKEIKKIKKKAWKMEILRG